MNTIFLLLLLFQIKHFLADYPLQGKFMLGKFKDKGWLKPLAAHSLVHAAFAFLIAICFVNFPISLAVAALDFVLHFSMDRIKASSKLLGRFESLSKDQFKGLVESRALAMSGVTADLTPDLTTESKRLVSEIDKKFRSNVYFWWSLGFDQSFHHLTHYLIIYTITKGL